MAIFYYFRIHLGPFANSALLGFSAKGGSLGRPGTGEAASGRVVHPVVEP